MASPLPVTALSRGASPSLQEALGRLLEEYDEKIRYAVGVLPAEDLWWRPRNGCNSVGNLLLHLAGNLSLWVIGGLGGRPVERHRAAELTATGGPPAAELVARLGTVVAEAATMVRRLDATDLARPVRVQGYQVTALDAALHAVEHMSYHTGQILLLAKMRRPEGVAVELYPQHAGE